MKKNQFSCFEYWTQQVANQEKWIMEMGGNLQGYIDRYGDPGVPRADGGPMYGAGGTAIYTADIMALQRAQAYLADIMALQRAQAYLAKTRKPHQDKKPHE